MKIHLVQADWETPPELSPVTLSLTEAPLQRTASWGAGDPGLHPRWFCTLLHSSFPSPALTYLPCNAYLLPRKTVSALLWSGLCREEHCRRCCLRAEQAFFSGTNIPSTRLWNRPTFCREKQDQRAELSLWGNQASKCLVLCLHWIRR